MSDPAILTGASNTDLSMGFFNDIFGVGWQDTISGTTPAGDMANVISEMLAIFNSVVLVGVMVLMFYVISAGIVGTAHEGEALGKRYSTLWTPLRGALSVSALMPLPWAKYSLIQGLLFKFVFFSISGASYLANKTVDQIQKQGGSMTLPAAPMISGVGLGQEILRNLVVQEYFVAQEGTAYNAPGYGAQTATEGKQSAIKIDFLAPNFSVLPSFDERMGELSVSCNASVPAACAGEKAAVTQLITALRPIASELGADFTGEGQSFDQLRSRFDAAITQYAYTSQQNATTALQTTVSEAKQQKLTNFTESIKNNGWISLGSYYLTMSQMSEEAHAIGAARAGIARPADLSGIARSAMKEYADAIMRTNSFLKTQTAGLDVNKVTGTSPSDKLGVGTILGAFFKDSLLSSFPYVDGNTQTSAAGLVSKTLSQGDPVLSLQALGHSLVNFGSDLAMISATAGVGEWVAGIFSAPKDANFAPKMSGLGVLKEVFGAVQSLITPLILPLMLCGLALAYYVPMLPFILWTSAVVSFLILTVELLVASSLWAAAHAIPEGEGMAGQHGRQGYMLFLGIVLRPSLHVVGFFMAFALSSTVCRYVGESYLAFAQNSGLGEAPQGVPAQMISWLCTLIIGMSLAITLMHKCFSLITWLPDNLLKWISGGTSNMGEHDDHHRTNQMFVGAMRGAPSAVTGAVSGVAGKLPKVGGGSKNQGSDDQPSTNPAGGIDPHTQGDKK